LDAAKKELVVTRPDDERQSKALHGLTRSLLANMIEGVTNGYKKSLEIQGVGYKAELKGKTLVMSVGYANTISVPVPTGVTVQVEGLKVHVSGPDKQLVGQFASDVRRVRKPEPYKGKGVRYEGEVVKIKPGKAFAGAGAAK
jgi:large subunit ribosomal protein L6